MPFKEAFWRYVFEKRAVLQTAAPYSFTFLNTKLHGKQEFHQIDTQGDDFYAS